MGAEVIALLGEDDDRGPLYGEPGLLDDATVASLVRRSRQHQSDPRKCAQAVRQRILKTKHRGDIEYYLRTLYGPALLKKLRPHISLAANPFEDVVRQVVALYKAGAIRRIDGVSDDEQAAFDELVTETKIAASAQGWAETGYAVGPQFIVPTIRRQKMRLLAPPPTSVDVVLDVEDPTGDPVAISYPSRKGVVVVDAEASRYYELTSSGHAVEMPEQRVEHGVGELPTAALRFTDACEDEDWWDCEVHKRLEDGAFAVGHIATKLSLVRKGQHGKLLALKGNLQGVPKGQAMDDPVGPVLLPTDGQAPDDPRRTEIETLDFDTDPKNHLTHLRAVTEWMGESTGVPVLVDTDGESRWDYTWDHDALAELRTSLLFQAHIFERQLWTFTVALARAQRHPLAARLPTPEQVAAGFHLDLPPLHRKFADPGLEQAHYEWGLKHGVYSVIDVTRRYQGHRSDKALWEQLMRNLTINAAWYDAVASRNLPASVTTDGTIQTAAQAQGALGPAVRDGRVPPPGGEGDNDNSP